MKLFNIPSITFFHFLEHSYFDCWFFDIPVLLLKNQSYLLDANYA